MLGSSSPVPLFSSAISTGADQPTGGPPMSAGASGGGASFELTAAPCSNEHPVAITTIQSRRIRLGFVQERIPVIGRRNERLFERARCGPAQEVERRAGFVVGARSASAAERLLADDGAGGLVVDIKVPGRVAEC